MRIKILKITWQEVVATDRSSRFEWRDPECTAPHASPHIGHYKFKSVLIPARDIRRFPREIEKVVIRNSCQSRHLRMLM